MERFKSAIPITRRASIVALTGMLSAASGARRPPASFHYAAHFTREEIKWYSRFELLVTGGILAPAVTTDLLQAGARLVAYEWSSAFYPNDPVSASLRWQVRVLQNGRRWVLNQEPAGGGAAEAGRGAYWYDFADPDLQAARAKHIAEAVSENGYSGVFLDTLGFEQLPPAMQGEFLLRHPALDYNQCQGRFLVKLRQALGDSRIIFSNQGYRAAADFLPQVDYDLSESAFSVPNGQHTRLRLWHDAANLWDGIRTPMDALVIPAARAYPRVRFIHLNYAVGDPGEIERVKSYAFAAAKLWNHDSYVVVPEAHGEEYPGYFVDLGKPLTAKCEEDVERGLAWREFEKGMVAISSMGVAAVVAGSYHIQGAARGYIFPK